jgi:hypothetical protein
MVQSDRAVANPAMLEHWLADPAVAAVDQGMVEYYWRGSVLRAGEGLDEQGWSLVERGRANRLSVVGAFHRAGVRMLVGTDTPQPFVVPGASVHEELANFVAAPPERPPALSARSPSGELSNPVSARTSCCLTPTRWRTSRRRGGSWASSLRVGGYLPNVFAICVPLWNAWRRPVDDSWLGLCVAHPAFPAACLVSHSRVRAV